VKRIIATFTCARPCGLAQNLHCHFVVIGEKAEFIDTQKIAHRTLGSYSECISICTPVLSWRAWVISTFSAERLLCFWWNTSHKTEAQSCFSKSETTVCFLRFRDLSKPLAWKASSFLQPVWRTWALQFNVQHLSFRASTMLNTLKVLGNAKKIQETHHLVKRRCVEVSTGLTNNKRHDSGCPSSYTSHLVSPKMSNVTWQSSVSLC